MLELRKRGDTATIDNLSTCWLEAEELGFPRLGKKWPFSDGSYEAEIVVHIKAGTFFCKGSAPTPVAALRAATEQARAVRGAVER